MIGITPDFLKWLKEDKWELKDNAPQNIVDSFNKYNEEYKKQKELSWIK